MSLVGKLGNNVSTHVSQKKKVWFCVAFCFASSLSLKIMENEVGVVVKSRYRSKIGRFSRNVDSLLSWCETTHANLLQNPDAELSTANLVEQNWKMKEIKKMREKAQELYKKEEEKQQELAAKILIIEEKWPLICEQMGKTRWILELFYVFHKEESHHIFKKLSHRFKQNVFIDF